MSQLLYTEQAAAFAGMIGDITNGMIKDTALNGEASAEIAFGKFVVMSAAELIDTAIVSGNSRGTPDLMVLPSAVGNDFAGGGFVMHAHDYDKRLELGTTGLKPKVQMNVMKRGRIWVNSGTAFAKADDVYVQYTAGIAAVGDIANASDGGKNVKLYGARVVTPIAAAGLCMVEFDMGAHRAH